LLEEAGFTVTTDNVSSTNPELVWMVGRVGKG